MFVIYVVFGTEGPPTTHSHENGLMKLQDQRTLGSIPLPGNEVVRHPYDPSDPNKFKFEIVRKLKYNLGFCQKYMYHNFVVRYHEGPYATRIVTLTKMSQNTRLNYEIQ